MDDNLERYIESLNELWKHTATPVLPVIPIKQKDTLFMLQIVKPRSSRYIVERL